MVISLFKLRMTTFPVGIPWRCVWSECPGIQTGSNEKCTNKKYAGTFLISDRKAIYAILQATD